MERLSNMIDYMVDNRGKNPPYYTEEGIPVIDTFLIGNSKYPDANNATRFIDEHLYNNFIRRKNKKDDLLVTLVGNGYGNSCLCNDGQVIIQNAVGLRFRKDISQLYVYYYFKQNEVRRWIQNLDRGSAQPNVKVSDLKRMKINLPNYSVQAKIAAILNNYDQLIENNNRRIKLLESMAEELYKEWFIRFRFYGYGKTEFKNGIPNEWEYKKFKEIITYNRGISYSSEEIDCIDGLNLINLKNINSYGGFRRDGTKTYNGKYKEQHIVKYKDLIMGVTDMTQDRRTVGHVALMPDIKGVISADLIRLDSNVNHIFLYCLCRYGFYSTLFSQFGNGANVIHLKPESIRNQKILMPNSTLINMFVKYIEPTIDEIEKLNKKNDLLIKQRDALLPRLMSGKLSVDGKEVI